MRQPRAAGKRHGSLHFHPFAAEENGVHYFDNLAVLKTASIPALLHEAGVIVHRGEELRMRDPAVRKLIADGIAAAVDGCLR